MSKRPAQPPKHFIREWRKYRRLSQEQLAERAGLRTHSAISHLENGRSEYTQSSLEALASVLHCQPGELLDVDPMAEGQAVDLTALLRGTPQIVREQILAVVATMLHSSVGGSQVDATPPSKTAGETQAVRLQK